MEDLNNEEYMLSTIDNPWNPFTNFTDWFSFDTLRGYNCCGRLAVYSNSSTEMSEDDMNEEDQRAIDRVIAEDPFGIYCKVKKSDTIKPVDIPFMVFEDSDKPKEQVSA